MLTELMHNYSEKQTKLLKHQQQQKR